MNLKFCFIYIYRILCFFLSGPEKDEQGRPGKAFILVLLAQLLDSGT